ncbi:WD40-repeat-containing domain protein [Entophlyctis helioformis]|nr:WD40-repeat-containing domain protein [Entophlyctis helioformis]
MSLTGAGARAERKYNAPGAVSGAGASRTNAVAAASKDTEQTPGMYKSRRTAIKFHANTDKVNVVKDPAIYRADREMNLAHFKELMQIFRKCSNNETGTISLDDFKTAFATVLGQGLTDEQMSILFMKIDANTDNAIDWDDFSTYMLLRAEGQKLMREEAETKLFDAESTRHPIATAHKDVIVRIQFIDSLKRYMSCSREGTLCYWNDRLKLQRAYRNAGQPRNEQIDGNSKKTVKTGPGSQHHRWIHDAVFMDNVNKVALASDDHQITIYDGTTLQKALCLDLQSVNVLTLDYWTDRDNPNATESMLLYGTDSGCVNVFTFNNDKMFKVGVRQKDQAEHIFLEKEGTSNRALKSWGSLWKRRAHGDWTVKVKYVPDLHAIISCSPDPRESLVVAAMDLNRKWQIHVSPVHKGVNAFAFCRFPVTLITGGTDRQLRLWNPHRLHHPMAAMKGHSSPITDITVNELNGQVISLSVDKDIKIWDIRKQQCLQTITDFSVHRPDDIISAIMFNPQGGKIVTGTYAITTYSLKEQTTVTDFPKSHDFPVRAVLYNSAFKQIVTGCDGSVVNVWDAFSGQKTFRFSEAHGKSEITAMAFDAGGRRLITGGRDGTIKIWNFNNGQHLQELVKKDKTEVTGLAYIDMKDSAYFVATGWNRKITIFADDPDSLTLYPIFTWPDPQMSGSALGWHEDDILSMAFCPPNVLATSSFDGEIVICNLYSGHVLHRLRPFGKGGAHTHKSQPKSRSIDKVLFLQERSGMREAASLVSTGSDGIVRFWNILYGSLVFEVDCTQGRKEGIFTLVTNAANTLLLTGDALGWVCMFDIRDMALDENSTMSMPLIVSFRAHVRSITGMDIIEGPDVMVTCSSDCTVRMFTMKGEFIGIFGQPLLWELGQLTSYMHPIKPLDVVQAIMAQAEEDEAKAAIKEAAEKMALKKKLAPNLEDDTSSSSSNSSGGGDGGTGAYNDAAVDDAAAAAATSAVVAASTTRATGASATMSRPLSFAVTSGPGASMTTTSSGTTAGGQGIALPTAGIASNTGPRVPSTKGRVDGGSNLAQPSAALAAPGQAVASQSNAPGVGMSLSSLPLTIAPIGGTGPANLSLMAISTALGQAAVPPNANAPGQQSATSKGLDRQDAAARVHDSEVQLNQAQRNSWSPRSVLNAADIGGNSYSYVAKATRTKTPELLKKEYASWYAKSIFAKETFQNRTKRKSNLLKPLNIGPGAGLRVYHRLQPYDLADVSLDRAPAETRLPQIGRR